MGGNLLVNSELAYLCVTMAVKLPPAEEPPTQILVELISNSEGPDSNAQKLLQMNHQHMLETDLEELIYNPR